MKHYIYFTVIYVLLCSMASTEIFAFKPWVISEVNESIEVNIPMAADIETVSVKYTDFPTSQFANRPELAFAYNVAKVILEGDVGLLDSYLLEKGHASIALNEYRMFFFASAKTHLDDLRIKYYMSLGNYFAVTYTLDSFRGSMEISSLDTSVFMRDADGIHLVRDFNKFPNITAKLEAMTAYLDAQATQATVPGTYQHLLSLDLPKPSTGVDNLKIYFNGSQPTWGREVILDGKFVTATADASYPLSGVLDFYRDTMLVFSKIDIAAITMMTPEVLALKSRLSKKSCDEFVNFIQNYPNQAVGYVQYKTDGIAIHYIIDADPLYIFVTSRDINNKDSLVLDYVEKDGNGFKMTYQLIGNPFMKFMDAPEVRQAMVAFINSLAP